MSLLDYSLARPWAKAIRASVVTHKMPPWFADPRYGHFSNDTRLNDREIETVKAWVDGGAAQGDPKDLPEPPKFAEGWRLGKPDVVIDIGQDFQVPTGKDLNMNFVVPTPFTEGRWVRAAQILPGNRKLVHHVHVVLIEQNAKLPGANQPAHDGFSVRKGTSTRVRDDAPVVNDTCAANASPPSLSGFEEGSLAALLPGNPPDVFDVFGDGSTAKYIPAGAKLRFEIHYAKVADSETDRTSIGLYLLDKAPERPLHRVDLRNRFFLIPAGAGNHAVRRCYDVEQDKLLVAITPHMHYRGKDATYELVHADGRREILLAVPHYDFNWQLQYRFEKPVLMEKGSRLEITFHYDNSANNPANPNPLEAIRWGDRTEDEMMATWTETLDVATAKPAPAGK